MDEKILRLIKAGKTDEEIVKIMSFNVFKDGQFDDRERLIEQAGMKAFYAMSKVIDDYEEKHNLYFDFEDASELNEIWKGAIEIIKQKFDIR